MFRLPRLSNVILTRGNNDRRSSCADEEQRIKNENRTKCMRMLMDKFLKRLGCLNI